MALTAIGSPVLTQDKDVTGSDLIAAVRILSSRTIEEVRRPTTWREAWWASRLRRNRSLLIAEAAKLIIYFQAQSLWPRFWEKAKKATSDCGTPWELVVVASLIRNGCTTEEAWTMPESEAVWLHIAHIQAEGSDVQVVSDHEWELMQRYLADEKAKAAKAAATTHEPNPRSN